MYYYKQLNENGSVFFLVTYENKRPNIKNPLVVEITKEEYETLSAEMQKQEEIPESREDEISDTEALNIIVGGDS